jgi:hypothetical protein
VGKFQRNTDYIRLLFQLHEIIENKEICTEIGDDREPDKLKDEEGVIFDYLPFLTKKKFKGISNYM